MTTVIEQIEVLAEKAPVGPWRPADPDSAILSDTVILAAGNVLIGETVLAADREFIVAVVNAAPAFLALARAAFEEHLCSNLRGRVDGCPECDALAALFAEVGA